MTILSSLNDCNLFQIFTPASAITIASFIKVKISDFPTRFHDEDALPTPVRHAVKVENRSGLTFVCMGRRLTHFPAE